MFSLAAYLPESCQTPGPSGFSDSVAPMVAAVLRAACVLILAERTAEVSCSEFAAQVLSWLFRVLSTQTLSRHLNPQMQARS